MISSSWLCNFVQLRKKNITNILRIISTWKSTRLVDYDSKKINPKIKSSRQNTSTKSRVLNAGNFGEMGVIPVISISFYKLSKSLTFGQFQRFFDESVRKVQIRAYCTIMFEFFWHDFMNINLCICKHISTYIHLNCVPLNFK